MKKTDNQLIKKTVIMQKMDQEIKIINEMIKSFDHIMEHIKVLENQAKTDPQAQQKLNKLIHGYQHGEERILYERAMFNIDKLINNPSVSLPNNTNKRRKIKNII
ncbi:type III secretion system filament chaperone [Edwardsiella anguillarum]|uniref:type III secretion system filament chaperone n=1 Tax=Edwardsiella anguillarum TaxID=1821960 RepID=UPI0024B6A0DE|nr:type III secretion system filament chaperone [Edwardsiella anguillarum]WHP79956.1 type III secretion system filament chaperone [Edwardsiella anguillarum]WHQ17416.1 type III secretion system filament chaperone [Edwardsiella anguillarum]WHQ20953.1 type III secretion system filament chaperone [Edwardsiella anguillarum]WHQ24476.1 type III secretion system filament chaperone [Edwardsiella anguillarum]WHQ28044.1 type III secretion system filament chaperone [Edwardsiella anguillarum]